MDNQNDKKFVPFTLSFLITLLILGTVLTASLIFFSQLPLSKSKTSATADADPQTVWLPEKQDRLLALFALAENKTTEPDVYALFGFLPDKGVISVTLLPPKTLITTGEEWSTITQLFDKGGIGYAAKQVGNYFGVEIDKYGYSTVDNVISFVEETGKFSYDLQTELDYPYHNRQVVLSRGRQDLSGRQFCDILFYPAYKGGETERSDRGAMLITQVLNYHMPAFLGDKGDSLIKTFLNNCEGNLSFHDYAVRSSSVRFLAELSLPASTATYIEGSLSRDYSTFLLTESCRARLASVYGGEGFSPKQDGQREPNAKIGVLERLEDITKPNGAEGSNEIGP